VARIEVQKRRKLVFLKKDGAFHLYVRQGNRTMEIPIDEVEDFLEIARKGRGLETAPTAAVGLPLATGTTGAIA
jgi:hypothetical protein